MILPANTYLYRYCVGIEPPQEWSVYFENPEYSNLLNGKKNQIGAFFFYANKETAINVAGCALSSYGIKHNIHNYTITSCKTIKDINLLDLRCEGHTLATLQILNDEGIDVLTNKYKKHDGTPFSIVRDFYHPNIQVRNNEDLKDKFSCIMDSLENYEVKKFFLSGTHSLLGQLLTDYENGITFKEILVSLGYEGYIFDEEQSSPTICLLNSEKLSSPLHQSINIE